MKKSIIILAALFAATFANAELTPEFSENYAESSYVLFYGGYGNEKYELPTCPFVIRWTRIGGEGSGKTRWDFLNPSNNYSVYKTIDFNDDQDILAITYDIFAVDKLAFLMINDIYDDGCNGDCTSNLKIIDEDGTIILDIPYVDPYVFIRKYGTTWKMLVREKNNLDYNGTEYFKIYSFPGDGSMPNSSEAISNPSPKHNAKKIVREGQVLVETENNTYDLRGQEVR